MTMMDVEHAAHKALHNIPEQLTMTFLIKMNLK